MKHYLKYEIKNTFGNIFAIIFGIIFPIMMTLLFYNMFKSEPNIPQEQLGLQLYLINVLMSPLAMVFVGFSALFSQEIENDVITRMRLFGYSTNMQLKTKFIAQMISIGIAFLIYSGIIIPLLRVPMPNVKGLIIFIAVFFLISSILFLIAYAITLLTRKFSITYGITMSIYFAIMILSGMMGIGTDKFPPVMKYISNLLPTTHFVKEMPTVWTTGTLSPVPLIQALIFFLAIGGILYMIALNKTKRRLS